MDNLGRRVSDIRIAFCRLGGFLPGGVFCIPSYRDGFSVGTCRDLAEKVRPVDRNVKRGQSVERGFGWVAIVVIGAHADDGVLGIHSL